MSISLQLSFLAGIILYILIILYFLRKNSINLRYSLIWLLSSVFFLIIDIFPGIITFIAGLIGIETASNAIFTLVMFFILIVLISLTTIVSKQNLQIKALVQELAILKNSVEEIDDKNSNKK